MAKLNIDTDTDTDCDYLSNFRKKKTNFVKFLILIDNGKNGIKKYKTWKL
jgi:hypothetical protein